MYDKMTLLSETVQNYPWAIKRGGPHEQILIDILCDKKPEIELLPILDKMEELLGHLPEPDWFQNGKCMKNYRTALLFGKVQSGKTIASIALSALALDNGFKNIIVLTSNVSLLQQQTKEDYELFLPEITHMEEPSGKNKNHLGRELKRMKDLPASFVIKKNSTSLDLLGLIFDPKWKNIRSTLPTLILDDEGDQASLKTDGAAGRRSIYNLIERFRESLDIETLVTVTATPFANLLLDEYKGDHLYPTIIQTLDPGKDYTGAKIFFRDESANVLRDVSYHEKERLTRVFNVSELPDGFKKSVIYHLLAAVYRRKHSIDGKHTMLINTEREKKEHERTRRLLETFLTDLFETLDGGISDDYNAYCSIIFECLDDIRSTVGFFEPKDIEGDVIKSIDLSNIEVVNSDSNSSINYGGFYPCTFLIGQTKIGRGLRIRGLVTTYFLYEPDLANMDTYSQACRFFGYRKRILKLMRIFCSKDTQKRWKHILIQEEWTIKYFNHLGKKRKKKNIGLIERDRPLIFSQSGLKATRKTENQISLKESPLDNWCYFQQQPLLDEKYSEYILKLVPKFFDEFEFTEIQSAPSKLQTLLNVEQTIVVLKCFKSGSSDALWLPDFLSDLFEEVYSHEPYRIENCVLIIGSNINEPEDLTIQKLNKNNQLDSPVGARESRIINSASQDRYPVIYICRSLINERVIWVPFLYLPPIEHGFGAS